LPLDIKMNTQMRKTKRKNESCWGDLIFICMGKVSLAGWVAPTAVPKHEVE
jgi:hypothetical protein